MTALDLMLFIFARRYTSPLLGCVCLACVAARAARADHDPGDEDVNR